MGRFRCFWLCVMALVPSVAWSAGVVVSSSAVKVPEGGTNTFTVRLDAAPQRDVTVAVSRASGDADISVSSPAPTWTVLAGDEIGALADPEGIASDAAGTLYIADTCHHRIQVRHTDGSYTIWGSYGTGAGQFKWPRGVAVDAAGAVYVADSNNSRVQKRDADGTWTVLAGSPASSQFFAPAGIAVDTAGNVYVADTWHNAIQKRDTDGVWTVWGSGGTEPGQFDGPHGVAVDTAGNVYVADMYNDRVQMRSAGGTWVVLSGSGEAVGQCYRPQGVALDAAGNLLVADSNNYRLQMRSPSGVWSAMGSNGTQAGQFWWPCGVAFDGVGNLYVVDRTRRCVQRRSTVGAWSFLTGSGSDLRQFDEPRGVAVDSSGNLYVADTYYSRVKRLDTDGVWTTLAGQGVSVGQVGQPSGLAADAAGNLYVPDRCNNRVQVRGAGGSWSAWGSLGAAAGQFTLPVGVAVDAAGIVYVSETSDTYANMWTGNNRVQKRDASGNWSVIATAGTALGQVSNPHNMTVDNAGNLWVADAGNNRVQRRDSAGNWTALGSLGAALGQLQNPHGVAVDAAGAVYVADTGNSRVQTRDPSGNWTALGTTGNAAGCFAGPQGVAVDADGDLYVADTQNDRIQKLCPGLTFTPSSWSTPQTVTLRAAEDPDMVDGVASIRCAATGWAVEAIAAATVTATEIDNDRQDLLATVSAVTVPEAGTATFGVKLSKAPASSVTVSVGRTGGDSDITVTTGATLIFTTSNWSTAQTVTLSAAADADTLAGVATVGATASGWTAVTVTATEADDDLRLVASPTAVTVPEGGTQSYGLSLAGPPTTDVKVSTARLSGDTSLTVDLGATLTFTAANWNIPQMVRLAAASDSDTTNGTAVIRSTATGWTAVDVTATEADDDLRIVVSSAAVTVPEGATAPVSVSLAGAPTATVVVAVAHTSGDADITVRSGASLTFTTANWSVPQTVTLGAVEDADGMNGVASLTASASGWASAVITATEADNDRRVVLSTSTVSLVEGGTATYTARLAAQPGCTVAVNTTRASGDASVSAELGGQLIFNSTNWSVPQTVRLRAANDVDAISSTAIMRSSATGFVSADVTASTADDDLRLLVSPASLTVPEGGTAPFLVSLAGQPAGSVAVTIGRQSGDTDLAVDAGASLTFTPANWNVGQTVRLRASADSDTLNGVAVFRAGATGWASADVTATEADDDLRIVVKPTAVSVPEGGAVTYTVSLAGVPTGNVVVSTARLSGDTGVTVDLGASLTFTPTNWNVPQTVRLRAAADTDAINGVATIRSSATGWAAADVTATEADDDARILLSKTAISVPEGGTATYLVALAGQPAADVIVATGRLSGDTSLAVDLGSSLTFTPSNWNVAQTVRLRAAADSDTLNGTATFRASAAGWTSADLTATEADDDLRLVVSTATLSVPEAGTATYTVALAGQPTGNVVVSTARLSGDSSVTVDLGASLTFTPTNWNVPQTVRLRAAADSDAINGAATMRSAATGWASGDVVATEADDDLRVLVSSASVPVPEGGAAAYTVSLAGQPAGNVVVSTARLSGDADVTVSQGATLTFTPTNWNVPQTVRLSAASDADAANGTAVLRSTATGWTAADVTATEADDDVKILLSAAAVSVPEAGTATFGVRLAGQPAANVVVSVGRVNGDTSLAVDLGASLTFTPANWNVAQTVRLRAAPDTDRLNGVATFRASGTGWTSADIVATEIDTTSSSAPPNDPCGDNLLAPWQA